MAKKNGEESREERSTAMGLDVVDEGRVVKEGLPPPPPPTVTRSEPPIEPSDEPAKFEGPRLRENFPLSPSDLPPREQAQRLRRKVPAADGNHFVQQICREDLDERPRLGKTIVVCPYDKVFCEPAGSERGFTLFTCPVEGCDHTRKIVKPMLRDILMRDHQQDDYSARA